MEKNKKNLSGRLRIPIIAAAVVLTALAVIQAVYLNSFPISIGGERFPKDTRRIDLAGRDLSRQANRLLKFDDLEYADLTGTRITPEQYDAVRAAFPDCEIKWSIPLGDEYYPCDTRNLRLKKRVPPSELSNIRYFTALRNLDAKGYPLCDELYAVTVAAAPSASYSYSVSGSLYGAEITSSTRKLDLSDRTIDDLSEFYDKLRFFPDVEKIYAGDAAVPDEEMDRLNRAFPDVNIVWLIEFAKWQVRTDIKVFSTQVGYAQPDSFADEDFMPLVTYCRDLEALDLGHNKLRNGSIISGLKKLELLIISYNYLEDLSFLYDLPKISFLEIRNNRHIYDMAPVGSLTDLQQVEMQHLGRVKNMLSLANCKKLNLLLAYDVTFDDCTVSDLNTKLRGCSVNVKTDNSKRIWSVGNRIIRIRSLFGRWAKIDIDSYVNWENTEFTDEPTCGWYITPVAQSERENPAA